MDATRTPLVDGWRVRAASGPATEFLSGEIPATVPGTVHTDLLAAGAIPDPYADANEAALTWIGESDFVYSTEFDRPAGDHERVDLVAEGLDTVAEVRVNGRVVGSTRNQHRSYRFDLGPVLQDEGNRLEVRFASAMREAREAEGRMGAMPHVNPLPFNALRKMACNFGWDWGPALVTCGIWRPLGLQAWSTARLAQVRPLVTVDGSGDGSVELHVDVERTGGAGALTVRARVAGIDATAMLDDDATSATLRLAVPQPARWWPRGHGDQALYDLDVELVADGEVLDTWGRSVGFRSVELCTEQDAIGTSFEFRVNGRPIWVKGANWIPDDCFLPRVTAEDYAAGVRDAVDGGFNLLRVWGGGTYESEELYAACDRAGVLLWQDFAFACAAYAEAPELRDEVEAEAREHIVRLAPHPSLVFWNGSNENAVGYYNWGWRDRLGEGTPWGDGYYSDLLPRLLAELDPTRPYQPSSPFSPGHIDDPDDPDDGSVHSWAVWNRLDYTAYADRVPRFVAEFGYQAPPQWRTLAGAVHDLSAPDAPALLAHQKADDGLGKLERGMAPHLAAPVDMAAWHFATQLVQARALAFGVAFFRANRPRCAGSIVWQLNDCWPVISWAIVDGARRRKPAWYAMRRVNASRFVTVQPRDGDLHLVLDNDTDEPWSPRVAFRRVGFDGAPSASAEAAVRIDARASATIPIPAAVARPRDPAAELLLAEVDGAERALHWFGEDPALALPPLALSAAVERVDGGWAVDLRAEALVKDLVLGADRLADDAEVDDQLVTLLPGERRRLIVTTRADLDPAALLGQPVLQSANTLAHPGVSNDVVDLHEGISA